MSKWREGWTASPPDTCPRCGQEPPGYEVGSIGVKDGTMTIMLVCQLCSYEFNLADFAEEKP